jgi:PAT family beta-lactamase induction signal transducer AmpG
MSKHPLEPLPADVTALLRSERARPDGTAAEIDDDTLERVVEQGRQAMARGAAHASPWLWVPSTFFAMGTVYVTVTSATSVLFVNLGLSNGQAAAYSSLAGLAYAFNAFWAPFLELHRTKKFFVVLAQLVVGATLAGLGAALGMASFVGPVVALLVLAAIAGATQDVACNGVYVTTLDARRQASFQGVQSMAWNLGPVLATSFLVLLVGHLAGERSGATKPPAGAYAHAWAIVFAGVGALLALLAAWHATVLPPGAAAQGAPRSWEDVVGTFADVFKSFARKRDVWKLVGFAFFYRFALGLLDKVTPLFLLDARSHGGLGLDNGSLGMLNGVATAALVVGSIVGGRIVATRGLRGTLWALCLALNVPDVTFLYLAVARPESTAVIGTVFVIEKLGWGIGAVGHMTYMMQQIAPGPYETAHYAFASALGLSLCMTLTGMVSGYLSSALGYQAYFVFVLLAAIPSFVFTWIAPFHQRHMPGATDS